MPRLLILFLVLSSVGRASEPAFPPVLSQFEIDKGEAVFAAAPGQWDAKIRERGWILRDGDRWRLWYTGYDGTREGQKKLGLATSTDGLHWVRHPANPIYDAGWVEDMMIVPHGGELIMFAEGTADRPQILKSSDGVAWQRIGPLDVRLVDGTPVPPGPLGTPTAFFENDCWHLFYERSDTGVWLATSRDMKIWTNVDDEPVLRPGPDAYDSSRIALNQIVKHDGRFYALYHGTDDCDQPALWTSNLAVSDDLRTWTKFSDNPLFPKSADRSSNVLVPIGDGRFRLYTMHGRVETFPPATSR